MKKVCFAASSGGHLAEISCLQELCEKYDVFLLTEKNDAEHTDLCDRVYYVNQINRRERGFLLHFLRLFRESSRVLKKEDPDCVVTTGALAAVPISILAKLRHKKLVYIESFARVTGGSLSGKILYHFADKFYVQWPELLEIYPKAEYIGGIF